MNFFQDDEYYVYGGIFNPGYGFCRAIKNKHYLSYEIDINGYDNHGNHVKIYMENLSVPESIRNALDNKKADEFYRALETEYLFLKDW